MPLNRIKSINTRKDERGVAFIELAITVPILLFLVLTAVEYSRVLERLQWASQLSREIASLGFRYCSASRDDVLAACLQTRVLNEVTNQANALAPGTEFVVAVFTHNEGGSGNVVEEGIAGGTTYRARFADAKAEGFSVANLTTQLNSVGTPGEALRENEVIVAATAYIPFTGATGGSVTSNLIFFLPDVVAASTVM